MSTIGNSSELHFELVWEAQPEETDYGLPTWGRLTAWVGEELVWGIEDDDTSLGVEWSWDQLLSFLADAWSYLVFEESYPLDLNPTVPQLLRSEAAQRWLGMPEAQTADEDEIIFSFEEVHDFSRGVDGIDLPLLFVLREGACALVATSSGVNHFQFDNTMATLESLGELIASRLAECESNYAVSLRERWGKRWETAPEHRIAISTGLPHSTLNRIAGSQTLEGYWELDPDQVGPTELMAAARMVGNRLSDDEIASVLRQIRSVPKTQADALDAISNVASLRLEQVGNLRPFDQGYELASWLRRRTGIVDFNGAVDPEAIVRSWGVDIHDVVLESDKLDAVCCWGPNHGPIILVNGRGPRSHYPTGRRSTLAHEMCHLLVDRSGSLPLVEVLGGQLPQSVEQRANAFAAEFLLPRALVRAIVDSVESIEAAINSASSRFDVSHEITAWQVMNSGVELADYDRGYLKRLTYKYRMFPV